jgi:hypothetical protein
LADVDIEALGHFGAGHGSGQHLAATPDLVDEAVNAPLNVAFAFLLV